MVLTEEEKMRIREVLRRAYSKVGKTGYDMKKCWKRDERGNITGEVDVECLREGGRAIGAKIRALWGKG